MSTSSTYKLFYSSYALVILYISKNINHEVPLPYMDEIFHISQARHYCIGDWNHWDPKLTTPAGLYLPSALLAHLLPRYERIICSTSGLRAVNSIILLLLPLLYSSIIYRLRHPILRPSTRGKTTPSRAALETTDLKMAAWEGLVLGLFPLAFFFGFLFYTDLASLALVLLSYERSLSEKWVVSAMFGGLSLLFRQTNVVWLAFIASTAIARRLSLRTRLNDPPLRTATFADIPGSMFSLIVSSITNISSLLPIILAYLPVFVAAGSFVYQNGGIVLGDKQNHVSTLHIPQLYYFVAFTATFLSPSILNLNSLRSSALALFNGKLRIAISLTLMAIMCWTIKHYTIAHPFILADNRHYTFYIWRRIINVHPFARYLLSPGYLLAARLIYDRLALSTLTLLPTLCSIIALALTIVPSPLIEPRYFLIPFVLLSLHLRFSGHGRSSRTRLIVQGMFYGFVNLVTILLFLYRPFKWEGLEELQRFMF